MQNGFEQLEKVCSLPVVSKTITLQIHRGVHQDFAKACKGRAVGRSMNDAATRIIAWFCRQKPLVQTAITADVDEGMELAYSNALLALALELREKAGLGAPTPTDPRNVLIDPAGSGAAIAGRLPTAKAVGEPDSSPTHAPTDRAADLQRERSRGRKKLPA